jgi:hypothetical protein
MSLIKCSAVHRFCVALAAALAVLVPAFLAVPAADASTSAQVATGELYVFFGSGGEVACSAWVAQSANNSVIGTAGHCVRPYGQVPYKYLFYPDWSSSSQPYGAYTAGPSDVFVDSRFVGGDEAYDTAFIVVHPTPGSNPVGITVGGGLPISFNSAYNQNLTIYGYPGGASSLQTCGPNGTSTYTGGSWQSSDPAAMKMQNGCNFTDGASGGPWVNSSGQVVASTAQQIRDCLICGWYNSGTYLGSAAQSQFNAAQSQRIFNYIPWINQAHGLCLDAAAQTVYNNGGIIQIWQCNRGLNQQWGWNGHELVNLQSGLCLDANAGSDGSSGDKVQLWSCWDGANQQWIQQGTELVNAAHGLCLDAAAQTDGTYGGNVQLWTCVNDSNQQWTQSAPSPPPTSYQYNVANVGSGTLHERTGPGTQYAIVGNLPNGAAISILCQTTGTSVAGSNIWDKLTNGSYVSDAYTTTPNFNTWSPPIPHPC